MSTTNSDAGVFRTLSRQALGDGFQAVYYRDEIAGLESGTKLYWCRAVAENSAGVGSSPWIEFTTEGSAPVQEPRMLMKIPLLTSAQTDSPPTAMSTRRDPQQKPGLKSARLASSSGIFDSSPRQAYQRRGHGQSTWRPRSLVSMRIPATTTGLVAENAYGTSASNFQSVQTEALPGLSDLIVTQVFKSG